MAQKAIIPFSEDCKDDCIATLRYIQSLRDEEAALKAKREEAEKWLLDTLAVNRDADGTNHYGDQDNFVTVEIRRTWKVDSSRLQEIVEGQELSMETVDRVIEWKPNLKVSEWKVLDEDAKGVLSQAVTSQTGKPSVKINVSEA